MADAEGGSSKQGIVSRLWRFLWRPSTTIPLAVLLIVGFFGGIVFWGAFHCVARLHQHRRSSASRATRCATIPTPTSRRPSISSTGPAPARSAPTATCRRSSFARSARKSSPRRIVFFHLTGKIDTPEKYEAHRLRDGAVGVGDDEGEQLARMPQLPPERLDGHQRRVRRRGAPSQGGAEGRQHDLHRLPPGHRPHLAEGVCASGATRICSPIPNAWLAIAALKPRAAESN